MKLTDDMNKENNVGETIKLALKITMKTKNNLSASSRAVNPIDSCITH